MHSLHYSTLPFLLTTVCKFESLLTNHAAGFIRMSIDRLQPWRKVAVLQVLLNCTSPSAMVNGCKKAPTNIRDVSGGWAKLYGRTICQLLASYWQQNNLSVVPYVSGWLLSTLSETPTGEVMTFHFSLSVTQRLLCSNKIFLISKTFEQWIWDHFKTISMNVRLFKAFYLDKWV